MKGIHRGLNVHLMHIYGVSGLYASAPKPVHVGGARRKRASAARLRAPRGCCCRRSALRNSTPPPPLLLTLSTQPKHNTRACSAIAAGAVIYTNAAKRVLVARFELPGGRGARVAKATYIDADDPRAAAVGALALAELRAYATLQAGGARHANVGRLDAALVARAPGCGGGGGGGSGRSSGGGGGSAAARRPIQEHGHHQQQEEDAAPPDALTLPPPPRRGYYVLLQPYYGGLTLDAYFCARLAAAASAPSLPVAGRRRRRGSRSGGGGDDGGGGGGGAMEPGCLEFERALLPALRAVASAVEFVHSQGLVLRDFKPGNVLMHGATLADGSGGGGSAGGGGSGGVLGALRPRRHTISTDKADGDGGVGAVAARRRHRRWSWGGGGDSGAAAAAPAAAAAAASACPTPVLIDFDGAVAADPSGAPPGEFTFTPPYLAPETARAAIAAAPPGRARVTAAAMARHGAAGDAFCLGVVAWQLAHASPSGVAYPFSRGDATFADDDAWLHAIAEDALPVDPRLSPPLLRLIAACLEKDPERRPGMAGVLALVDAWDALLSARPALPGGDDADGGVGADCGGGSGALPVPLTAEQLAADAWAFVGPTGEVFGPLSGAQLLAALRLRRLPAVAPVLPWSALGGGGCGYGGGALAIPLGELTPALRRHRQRAARAKRETAAAAHSGGGSGAAYTVAAAAAPAPQPCEQPQQQQLQQLQQQRSSANASGALDSELRGTDGGAGGGAARASANAPLPAPAPPPLQPQCKLAGAPPAPPRLRRWRLLRFLLCGCPMPVAAGAVVAEVTPGGGGALAGAAAAPPGGGKPAAAAAVRRAPRGGVWPAS